MAADSTLINGAGTFTATLRTAGSQTLTARDTVTPSITGISAAITVSAGTATQFTVLAPASATAGAAFSFAVTARDASGNTATGYSGIVHFAGTDARRRCPRIPL